MALSRDLHQQDNEGPWRMKSWPMRSWQEQAAPCTEQINASSKLLLLVSKVLDFKELIESKHGGTKDRGSSVLH
eukprot:1162054-Pelagomonas_calceolata.AAC.2